MNMRKIIVVQACPIQGYTNGIGGDSPNHHRYSVYERKEPKGSTDWSGKPEYRTISNILLRYEDKSIEDFLNELDIMFSVSRGLKATLWPGTIDSEDTFSVPVSGTVEGTDRVVAKHLGENAGYQCYLIYKKSHTVARKAPAYFSIKRVPDYGRSSVVYQVDTARKCFTARNLTNVIHEAKSGSELDQLQMFDWIEERVAPIMAPMVALLPEPKPL